MAYNGPRRANWLYNTPAVTCDELNPYCDLFDETDEEDEEDIRMGLAVPKNWKNR